MNHLPAEHEKLAEPDVRILLEPARLAQPGVEVMLDRFEEGLERLESVQGSRLAISSAARRSSGRRDRNGRNEPRNGSWHVTH